MSFRTITPEQTERIGYCLGTAVGSGDLICINGPLGSGKTVFTRGVARSLGFAGPVTSPTFTVVNEYEGRLTIYHLDVYRIDEADELYNIGFEDYLDGSGVVIIEWAENVKDALPVDYIEVIIKPDAQSENVRDLRIILNGERYTKMEPVFCHLLKQEDTPG